MPRPYSFIYTNRILYLYLKISRFDKKWNFLIIIEYENTYRLYIGYNRFQIRFFNCFYPTLVYYYYLTLIALNFEYRER